MQTLPHLGQKLLSGLTQVESGSGFSFYGEGDNSM